MQVHCVKFEVAEEAPNLEDYVRVGVAFEVDRVFDVTPCEQGLGGFALAERKLPVAYLKDYDAINSPLQWPAAFDMSNWGFLAARCEGVRLGGAIVAYDTPGPHMLEGRTDLAVLWDLRVARPSRRLHIGTALFAAAEEWAGACGCRWLKVETQNNNVAACRFYARQGCVLGAIHRYAYPGLPHEAQLLWYKDLAGRLRTL